MKNICSHYLIFLLNKKCLHYLDKKKKKFTGKDWFLLKIWPKVWFVFAIKSTPSPGTPNFLYNCFWLPHQTLPPLDQLVPKKAHRCYRSGHTSSCPQTPKQPVCKQQAPSMYATQAMRTSDAHCIGRSAFSPSVLYQSQHKHCSTAAPAGPPL